MTKMADLDHFRFKMITNYAQFYNKIPVYCIRFPNYKVIHFTVKIYEMYTGYFHNNILQKKCDPMCQKTNVIFNNI